MKRGLDVYGVTRAHVAVALAISAVVLAALTGLLFLLVRNAGWSGSIDYGKRPVAATFVVATGATLPRGVSNLSIAGHS